ncbi:MAG: AsmA family protein [Edaphobacter sp.]|nr:AsmA family protein [Edaphobacter sp.]
MQEIDTTYAQSDSAQPESTRVLRRLLYASFALLALLLLVLLPPLISVNRFQRRIATSISNSLGRPVHLDRVSLNLLPLPGFTLQNLVVSEDPAFGTEPIIRANSVRATLRISSLWSKRVEFSTISFTEPSVNLVHATNGKWNLESILLQASRIEAAPTAQTKAGPEPRFPYIEATGARLNLKQGQEKLPLSLTEAEFALWLPNPQEWHLRLQARPTRTDTNISDAGIIQVEGTLGHAESLGQVPLKLEGEWRNAPLGEASRLVVGHDAGLRGEMTLTASVGGTVGNSSVQTRLRLNDTRRSDFVPAHTLSVDVECLGTATGAFHAFENVRCSWPPAGSGAQTIALAGSLPDVRRLESATVEVGTPGIPASTLLEWLRIASARVPADVSATGTMTGSFSYHPGSASPWEGEVLIAGASLKSAKAEVASLVAGDIVVRSVPRSTVETSSRRRSSLPSGSVFVLSPVSLALGGKEPATLEGYIDASGYTLHLGGMATASRLLELGVAMPQFGDSLSEIVPTNRAAGPFRIDLAASRPWGGQQVWRDASVHTSAGRSRRVALD